MKVQELKTTEFNKRIKEGQFCKQLDALRLVIKQYKNLPLIKNKGYFPAMRLEDFEIEIDKLEAHLEELIIVSETWEGIAP